MKYNNDIHAKDESMTEFEMAADDYITLNGEVTSLDSRHRTAAAALDVNSILSLDNLLVNLMSIS